MSSQPGSPDQSVRGLAKVLHERYQLAARIARATWPEADTSPEAMVAATGTIFCELNRLIDAGPSSPSDRAAAGLPDANSSMLEIPTRCPECGAATKDQRATRTARQPLVKCTDRACPWALWPPRVRGGR
jgi:hypothetical protein